MVQISFLIKVSILWIVSVGAVYSQIGVDEYLELDYYLPSVCSGNESDKIELEHSVSMPFFIRLITGSANIELVPTSISVNGEAHVVTDNETIVATSDGYYVNITATKEVIKIYFEGLSGKICSDDGVVLSLAIIDEESNALSAVLNKRIIKLRLQLGASDEGKYGIPYNSNFMRYLESIYNESIRFYFSKELYWSKRVDQPVDSFNCNWQSKLDDASRFWLSYTMNELDVSSYLNTTTSVGFLSEWMYPVQSDQKDTPFGMSVGMRLYFDEDGKKNEERSFVFVSTKVGCLYFSSPSELY